MLERGSPPSPDVQYLKLSFCTQITTAAPFAASKNNCKEVFQSCVCFPSVSSTSVLVARASESNPCRPAEPPQPIATPHPAHSNARTSVITRSECLTWLNQHHCSQTKPVLQAYRHPGVPPPAPQAVSPPANQQDPQAPLSALPDKATTIPSQHSHRTVLAFEGNQQVLQLASTLFQRQKLISASLTIYPS